MKSFEKNQSKTSLLKCYFQFLLCRNNILNSDYEPFSFGDNDFVIYSLLQFLFSYSCFIPRNNFHKSRGLTSA